MSIIISGTLTVQDTAGQNHIINADDFTEDPHSDGTSVTFDYDNGSFSANIIAEKKNGAISNGDWETKNCQVITNNISFS